MKKNVLREYLNEYITDGKRWRRLEATAASEYNNAKSSKQAAAFAHQLESIMAKVPATEEKLHTSLILLQSKFAEMLALREGLERAENHLKLCVENSNAERHDNQG